MVTTLQSVKVLSVNVPAVLVTGKDDKGNEFGYRKSGDEWVDYYNECATTPERIRRDVFPNVQYVRYQIDGKLGYKMSRAEWIENGCPLDLPKSVVELMIETEPHPVDFTQRVEREIDRKIGNRIDSVEDTQLQQKFGGVKITASADWRKRHLHQSQEEINQAKELRQAWFGKR